ARLDVAAHRLDAQVGARMPELRLASQAGRADDAARGNLVDAHVIGRHEGVEWVLALQHGDDLEALRDLCGDVLHGVHRDVRPPFEHGALELLDEQALAADLGQRRVEDLVATRCHRHQLDGQARVVAAQQRRDMLGLPEGEAALPGRDPDRAVHPFLILLRTWGAYRRLTTNPSGRPSRYAHSRPCASRSTAATHFNATRALR